MHCFTIFFPLQETFIFTFWPHLSAFSKTGHFTGENWKFCYSSQSPISHFLCVYFPFSLTRKISQLIMVPHLVYTVVFQIHFSQIYFAIWIQILQDFSCFFFFLFFFFLIISSRINTYSAASSIMKRKTLWLEISLYVDSEVIAYLKNYTEKEKVIRFVLNE